MKISVDVMIDKPQDEVWKIITDIENSPDMLSGIVALKILRKPETGLVGLKWQETRLMFGKETTETMWITEAQETSHYHVRAENHGAIYLSVMSINPVNDKTQLTMDFSATAESFFVKMMSALMALFVKKYMVKMLQKDLDEIKTYLEQS